MFAMTFLLVLSLKYASSINFDESDIKNNAFLNATSSTNTYSEAYNYGKTHPTRDGGSWNGWFNNSVYDLILQL
jgi:hypothetical protein